MQCDAFWLMYALNCTFFLLPIANGEELFLDYGYSKIPTNGTNDLYPWHDEQLKAHR